MPARISSIIAVLLLLTGHATAQPLHQRIDAAVEAGTKGPFAKLATDDEFLRRVWLDFAGVIPPASETRTFLADKSPDKRVKLIERLAQSPDFPRRMAEAFSVMFEERRTTADSPVGPWEEYLLKSFAADKSWDQLAREIIAADTTDPAKKSVARFYLERSGDAHLLTKDVGRLFLGRDVECSRCHDHPTVKDYKQADYYGLYAFLNRSFVFKNKNTFVFAEKASPGKVDFESVFTMQKGMTGPHLPGLTEIDEPKFAKDDDAYIEKPNPKKGVAGQPKFSARAVLAKKLTEPDAKAPFVRNSANRLWFIMMGRGVVHPLDQHHSENPPSNPKLLVVLSEGLVELKFDVRGFLREIALSKTYQRSSMLPAKIDDIKPGSFTVAELRNLSPEQLLYSIAQATGRLDKAFETAEAKLKKLDAGELAKKRRDPVWRASVYRDAFDKQMKAFVTAFGSRAGEAETDFQPSLAGALYLSNERMILDQLKSQGDNLAARLEKLQAADALADELYVSVLSRRPTAAERNEVAAHLTKRGDDRAMAIQELAWALLASTEFRLNH
jgi:hypothetical protein